MRTIIDDVEATTLEVSALSLVEIAIKHNSRKLDASEHVVRTTLDDLDAHVLPYTAAHAFRNFLLPLHHKDPFDRMLIAQALAEDIPIVTPDESFRKYKGLKVIWK